MSLPEPKGLISDVIVPLPEDVIKNSCGLALDIGSTIGKIIYRSNKEYENGSPIKPMGSSGMGQLHFAMFPRSDIGGMLNYVKENCDLSADKNGERIVNCSGVGGAAYRVDIETGLNCKFEVILETDCFCKAFLQLEKVLPEEEFLIPKSNRFDEKIKQLAEVFERIFAKIGGMTEVQMMDKSQLKILPEEDRPRLMVMAGSGTAIMQVNNNGTFSWLDTSYIAGRFMYGLSSILTGENDFKKLEQMASNADGKTADIWSRDLTGNCKIEEGSNVYEDMSEVDDLAFPFGKGVTVAREDMKKEDLVFSVFNTCAMVHAQQIAASVKLSNAKAVYFSGNVFNTEIMRDLVDLAIFKVSVLMPPSQKFDIFFLKNGGMYGALGAYLHTAKGNK